MHALVLLSKRVLNHALEDRIHAVRTDKKVNVPVVMTRDEVATILSLMAGTPQLAATSPWRSSIAPSPQCVRRVVWPGRLPREPFSPGTCTSSTSACTV